MDDLQYDDSGRARVTLELSRDIIEILDRFRAEWGLKSRGAIVERLLHELFQGIEVEK